MCTFSRGYNIVMNRARASWESWPEVEAELCTIGMSIDVSWFPDYGLAISWPAFFLDGFDCTDKSKSKDFRSWSCFFLMHISLLVPDIAYISPLWCKNTNLSNMWLLTNDQANIKLEKYYFLQPRQWLVHVPRHCKFLLFRQRIILHPVSINKDEAEPMILDLIYRVHIFFYLWTEWKLVPL